MLKRRPSAADNPLLNVRPADLSTEDQIKDLPALSTPWKSLLGVKKATGLFMGPVAAKRLSQRRALMQQADEELNREEQARRERERREKVHEAALRNDAMRAAIAHALALVEGRERDLALREYALTVREAALQAATRKLPPEQRISKLKATTLVRTESWSQKNGITSIGLHELSELRGRLREYEQADEMRQRVVAEQRLVDRRKGDEEKERLQMRASERIMRNWKYHSLRRCYTAWSFKTLEGRQHKLKMHKVAMRLKCSSASKSFSQWSMSTAEAHKAAERKQMEDQIEKVFRTKLYASFSGVQTGLRGELADADSLRDTLKERTQQCESLKETISDMERRERELLEQVEALRGSMADRVAAADADKAAVRQSYAEQAAEQDAAFAARIAAAEQQKKKIADDARLAVLELEENLREAEEKCEEWKAMYQELQQLMENEKQNPVAS